MASFNGSTECTFCSAGFFRPSSNASADQCTSCEAVRGVGCGTDTVKATLDLRGGYWRHSNRTLETWRCKHSGDWSPCRGGEDAGHEGNGYCVESTDGGYRGPRCELCVADNYHFDKLDARCHDCGDVASQASVVSSALFLLILIAFSGSTVARKVERRLSLSRSSSSRRTRSISSALTRSANAARKWMHTARGVWRRASMRYKVKSFVGFFQCIAVMPGIFNVLPPVGLEEYRRWMDLLELPAAFEGIFVPPACLGDYRTQIWIASTWPLLLVLLCALIFLGIEAWRNHRSKSGSARRRPKAVITAAGRAVLPLLLGLTFLVVPSTSTRLFKTFLCDRIEYNDTEERRYLHAYLELSCDSDDYKETRRLSTVMLGVWPIGIPLLYTVLLVASRHALLTDNPTALSMATDFLSGDCTPSRIEPKAGSIRRCLLPAESLVRSPRCGR